MVNETIRTTVSELYGRSWDSHGMLVLETDASRILPLITRLKRSFYFDLLLDITGVDYPARVPRFDVVYHLYSPRNNVRVRIKVPVTEAEPNVPTLTGLYGSARYIEREVHEMYGIVSIGNDDLRPILLYEGFEGHPLRKDYPIDMEQPIVAYRK